MSYRYQLGLTDLLYHLQFVSLLIFCLVDLSIGVSGVLNSPTIIVLLLVSPFILVSICLTYCSAPILGAYIFIIVISSSWIDSLLKKKKKEKKGMILKIVKIYLALL